MKNQTRKEWPRVIKRGNATVRIYKVERTKRGRQYTDYKLAYYNDSGRRKMESFAELADAERRAGDVAAAITRGDAKTLLALSAEEQLIYQRAKQTLARINVPLDVAVSEYASAHEILKGASFFAAAKYFIQAHEGFTPRRVADVVAELITLRAKRTVKGRPASDAYLRDLNTRLVPFGAAFGCEIHQIKPAQIESYLDSAKLTGRNRNNSLKIIRTLIQYAKARKYIQRDVHPMEGLELRFDDESEIGVFTPAELRRLIAAAQEHHPELLPFLAVGAFAGLRSAEIARLEWAKIGAEYIEVSAAKAKTRSRRLVPIQPNLAAWLATFKRDGPTVVNIGLINHGFRCLTDATKRDDAEAVVWKNNGLRHSFITYRHQITKDEGKVASEAGNSPTMIHKHYRGLVTDAQAGEWFEVKP